jgi:hypothetical protein
VYDGEFIQDDAKADASYRLFWLKNIAPIIQNGAAKIPLRRFPGFLAKTGWDILTAADEFRRARKWVAENGGRFKCDAQAVLDLWPA